MLEIVSKNNKFPVGRDGYRCRFGGRVITRARHFGKTIVCPVPAESSVMTFSEHFHVVPNGDLFLGSFVHRKDVISDVTQAGNVHFWRKRQSESEVSLFARQSLSAFLELDPNVTAPNVTKITTPTLTSVLGDVELVLGNAFNRLASASLKDTEATRRLVRLEEDMRVVLKNVSKWRTFNNEHGIPDRVVIDSESGNVMTQRLRPLCESVAYVV